MPCVSKVFLACVAVIAVAVLVVFLTRPPDHFRRKYDQIKPEMSIAEVSAILGPSDEIMRPGGNLGDVIHFWNDSQGRTIKVTWPLTFGDRYNDKEYITWPPPAWWKDPVGWWARTPVNPNPPTTTPTLPPPLPPRN